MMDEMNIAQPELNLANPKLQYLSFSDAAQKVLEQFANNQPMHYRDITEKALDKQYLNSQGITPAQTMRVVIKREIDRYNARGERPRFYIEQGGYIGLTAWQKHENDLFRQIERHNLEIKEQYLKKLKKLTPQDFEIFIGELLAKLQFDEIIVTGHSNDGGIDIKAVLNVAGSLKTRMAVQVKKWKNNVLKPEIQRLRGALGSHEQGLFITTSNFSKGAIEEAERQDAAPIALINGKQLVDILVENEIAIKKNSLEWIELNFSASGQAEN